jgi:hypothetical protein
MGPCEGVAGRLGLRLELRPIRVFPSPRLPRGVLGRHAGSLRARNLPTLSGRPGFEWVRGPVRAAAAQCVWDLRNASGEAERHGEGGGGGTEISGRSRTTAVDWADSLARSTSGIALQNSLSAQLIVEGDENQR